MNLFAKTALFDLSARIKKLDEGRIFIEVMKNEIVQKFIVNLNTNQLRFDFMNADGILLSDIGGEYSPTTMQEGKKKSKTSVDLYDTGDYHESFRVTAVTRSSFDITSDPIKSDGTNLLQEWGKEIEGLTFESLEKLITFMIEFYRIKLREYLVQ